MLGKATSKELTMVPRLLTKEELGNVKAGYAFLQEQLTGTSLPLESRAAVSEHSRMSGMSLMFSLFRQPTPSPDALLDDTPDLHDRTLTMQVLISFKWLSQAKLDVTLARDSSGHIRRLFERTWSHMLRWMKFLVDKAHRIGGRGSDPVPFTQSVVAYISASLSVLCQRGCFQSKVIRDQALFTIVVSAYLKQDVAALIAMDDDIANSNAPAFILTKFVAICEAGKWTASTRVLQCHEQKIVKIALQHLHYALALPTTTSAPLRKVNTYARLLGVLVSFDSFARSIIKTRTVTAFVATLKFTLKKTHLNTFLSYRDHQGVELLPAAVDSLLYVLAHAGITLCGETRANISLCARIDCTLPTLSRLADGPLEERNEKLLFLLTQLAGNTIYCSSVGLVAKGMERAFTKDPNLAQYQRTGRIWSLVQRYATERMVCRFLFVEAYRRYGRKCWACSARIPRHEIKTCSGCITATYCSRKCQKTGWPVHKDRCRRPSESNAGMRSIYGKDGLLWISFMAKCDISRLLPAIYDCMKKDDPYFTFEDGYFEIDYIVFPGSFYPVFSYKRVSGERGASLREEIRQQTADSPYDCVISGATKLVRADILVPRGHGKLPFSNYVPIYNSTLEVACDSGHPSRTLKPRPVTSEHFQRVECCRKDSPLNGTREPLHAVRDDVDDILYELESVTRVNPQLRLSQRVRHAAAKVEEDLKREGRDLYERWTRY